MSDSANISFMISTVEKVRPVRLLNTEANRSWFVIQISHHGALFKEAEEELLELLK